MNSKLSKKGITKLAMGTEGRVSPKEISHLYKLWQQHCPKGKADLDIFKIFYGFAAEAGGNDYASLPVAVDDLDGIHRLFCGIDKDGDGLISFDEFVFFTAVLKNPKPEELISVSFALLDIDGSGEITKEELTLYLTNAKGMMTESESDIKNGKSPAIQSLVEEIFAIADANNDNRLTLEEVLDAAKNNSGFVAKFCV